MRTRARALLIVASLLAAGVCVVHGVLQGVSAVQFWAVCFAEYFDSPACLYQQYQAPMPWWQHSLWPWAGETALAISVVVAAVYAKRSVAIAWVALIFVGISNVVTDYLMGPILNGGYTSADSAPGVGYFGATTLCIAGILYVTIAAWAAIVRHSRQSGPSTIAEHV